MRSPIAELRYCECGEGPDLSGFSLRFRFGFDDSENIRFAKNNQIFAVNQDIGSAKFAEQDGITGFHVERRDGAVLAANARTDGDYFEPAF